MEERERQIAHVVYEHFLPTGAHDAALDLSDLHNVSVLQDGTKLFWLQVKYPMRLSWKVCAKCEYVGLCSLRPQWQCMNRKSMEIRHCQAIKDKRQM